MKRTLISALAVMLALWPAGAGAQKKRIGIEKPEIEKPEVKKPSKKPPEGAIIQGNKITLKLGYQFVKQSDNTVSVKSARAMGISGTFSCDCYVKDSDDCKLAIQKSSAVCGGKCTDCRIYIVVNPPITPHPSKNAPEKKSIN